MRDIVFQQRFKFLFQRRVRVVQLMRMIFITPLHLPIILRLFRVAFHRTRFLLLAPRMLRRIFRKKRQNCRLRKEAIIPNVTPMRRMSLQTIPDHLLAMFTRLVRNIIRASRYRPSFIFSKCKLPTFLRATLRMSSRVRIFRDLRSHTIVDQRHSIDSYRVIN